jgi:hypothetical protein
LAHGPYLVSLRDSNGTAVYYLHAAPLAEMLHGVATNMLLWCLFCLPHPPLWAMVHIEAVSAPDCILLCVRVCCHACVVGPASGGFGFASRTQTLSCHTGILRGRPPAHLCEPLLVLGVVVPCSRCMLGVWCIYRLHTKAPSLQAFLDCGAWVGLVKEALWCADW